jgi:hypothetical protein
MAYGWIADQQEMKPPRDLRAVTGRSGCAQMPCSWLKVGLASVVPWCPESG